MAKSFREKIEGLLFAGLKPRTGGEQNDPLYLTNRTWQQRARVWLMIGVPCLAIAVVVGLAMSGIFKKRDVAYNELTPAQVAVRALPPEALEHMNVKVERELDVLELRVEHEGATRIVGRVRNRTDKSFAHAELVLDLTDAMGSRLGASSVEVEHIGPGATVPFTVSISQNDAAVAMVRDIQTQ